MLDTNYSARTTYTAKLLPKMLWYFRCHQFRWHYLIYNYQNEKAQSEYGYQSYWRTREIKHYCTHTHKVDVDMLAGNTFLFIEPVFFFVVCFLLLLLCLQPPENYITCFSCNYQVWILILNYDIYIYIFQAGVSDANIYRLGDL